MSSTLFKKKIEDKTKEAAHSLLQVDPTDVARIARIQGRVLGLQESIGIFDLAMKTDMDE